MSNAFHILVNILQDFGYVAIFIGAAVVVYLTFQQPRPKAWLTEAGPLVRVVIFIALTEILAIPFNSILGDLFALPRDLISLGQVSNLSGDFVATLAQCCGGVLMLVCLGVGSWLLVKRYPAGK